MPTNPIALVERWEPARFDIVGINSRLALVCSERGIIPDGSVVATAAGEKRYETEHEAAMRCECGVASL